MKKLNLLFVSILLIVVLAIIVYASPTVELLSPEQGHNNTNGSVHICV